MAWLAGVGMEQAMDPIRREEELRGQNEDQENRLGGEHTRAIL